MGLVNNKTTFDSKWLGTTMAQGAQMRRVYQNISKVNILLYISTMTEVAVDTSTLVIYARMPGPALRTLPPTALEDIGPKSGYNRERVDVF